MHFHSSQIWDTRRVMREYSFLFSVSIFSVFLFYLSSCSAASGYSRREIQIVIRVYTRVHSIRVITNVVAWIVIELCSLTRMVSVRVCFCSRIFLNKILLRGFLISSLWSNCVLHVLVQYTLHSTQVSHPFHDANECLDSLLHFPVTRRIPDTRTQASCIRRECKWLRVTCMQAFCRWRTRARTRTARSSSSARCEDRVGGRSLTSTWGW